MRYVGDISDIRKDIIKLRSHKNNLFESMSRPWVAFRIVSFYNIAIMLRGKTAHSGFEQEFGKNVDPHHIFMGLVPHMVDISRKAAKEEAYSYRGFHVGASLLAFLPRARETLLFSAGNTKYENQQKICAEKALLEQLDGYARVTGDSAEVIGLVVVGTSDKALIEGVTGLPTHTLHPCRDCRGMLGDSPGVTEDMLIVTAGLQSDAHQTHTLGQLQAFYAHDAAEAALHTNPDFDNWHTRQAYYDYMISPYGGGHTPTEAAGLAVTSVFMRPAETRRGMSNEQEAEILKTMAKLATGL